MESFVAGRSDACINVRLVLDEVRFDVRFVEKGRALWRRGENRRKKKDGEMSNRSEK